MYVFDLCKKAGRKLSILPRLSHYMSFEKKNITESICRIAIWILPINMMFHCRRANLNIKHNHERDLRIVYKNDVLSFEGLLELDKSFKIHHRNIQSLAIELFKIKNNLSVTIMNDIFQPRAVTYTLSSQIDFTRPNVNSEHFGINSLRYMAAKIWDMVHNDTENVIDIETFKNNIRKWKPVNCSLQDMSRLSFLCRLC